MGRHLDLSGVYGSDWSERSRDLVRYFVKHIGCRLANHARKRPVIAPSTLVDFLDGSEFPTGLQLDAALDESIARIMQAIAAADGKEHQEPFLSGWLGVEPLWGTLDPATDALIRSESGCSYRWFTLYWQVSVYDPPVDPLADRIVRLTVAHPTFREAAA